MPLVDLPDGAELYFEDEGHGQPLLLVHGFSAVSAAWRESGFPTLADRFRVIMPDLRGHGRSTGAPETLHHARFGEDMLALLDHLGIECAHCVGHSSGGMALLFVAIGHQARVQTLTLASARYTFTAQMGEQMRRAASAWETQPEWIEMQRQRHGGERWRELLAAFRTWPDDPAELPFQPADLAAITCPTLVLNGDRDPMLPVAVPTAMYEAMPNAELAILPGVGHLPFRDRPELSLRLLADFLTRRGA